MRKSVRAKLKLLRLNHAFDPFAASEAFVLCHAEHIELPRWAGDAIAARLREEIGNPNKRETAERKRYRKFARWHTVNFYRQKGFSPDEAIRLAARAYGGEESAEGFVETESTIRHDYLAVRREMPWRKNDHLTPDPEGFENVTPIDLPEGPKQLPRPDLPESRPKR